MADSSLLSVVVGGLLTMGGGIIAGGVTWAVNLFQANEEKKKRRADKLEELVMAIYEHEHWLDRARDIQTYGNAGELGMSPFAKIQTLSAIYFPVFATRVEELYSTSKQFEVWITKGAKKRLQGDIASINDGLDAAYKPYLDCLRAFAADVRTYAKQEFE